MKKKVFFISLSLLLIIPKVNGQTIVPGGWECGTINETLLRSSTSGGNSTNGHSLTPRGDIRALIICVGFGTAIDSQTIPGWDSAPDALPNYLKDGSLFYTDFSQFPTNPYNVSASAIENISAYFYAMSRGKFRFVVTVYPKRINVAPGGYWSDVARKAINQMKIQDPNFNWSPYDNRKNSPNYATDNSGTVHDNIPDYIILIYRFSSSFNKSPCTDAPPGNAYDAIDLYSSDNFNGYTFLSNCGYTQIKGGDGYNTQLFIHEVAHNMYDAPHVSGANGVMGNYYYLEKGWSQMDMSYLPYVCSNAWERWYLGWSDTIQSSGVNADIKSSADIIKTAGKYVLRDFVTTGDAVRIKIPYGTGTNGRNQYLWLENHQGKTVYDTVKIFKSDQCNTFPRFPQGIVAFIESINDNKDNPGYFTIDDGANGIKYIHAAGNFDFTFDPNYTTNCWYGNPVYNFHRAAINPISGQCGAEEITNDFNSNNKIETCNHSNSPKQCYPAVSSQNDYKTLIKRDNNYVYDFMNGERAFAKGSIFSMSSNPCFINRPTFDFNEDKMSPYYLNGISITILDYDSNGNATIQIKYNDINISKDIRYAGTAINLPNITSDANPDINIMENVTLQIDKSGTPNKQNKTVSGDFINPTVFTSMPNSYFVQSSSSKVWVENGSSLIIENGAKYEVNSNAELAIKSGSNLTIKSGGILSLKSSSIFTVELGATLTLESGAIIDN